MHRPMSLSQWNVTPHDHQPLHQASTSKCLCTRLCVIILQGTYSNNIVVQHYTGQNVNNSPLRIHKKTVKSSFPVLLAMFISPTELRPFFTGKWSYLAWHLRSLNTNQSVAFSSLSLIHRRTPL